MRITKCLQKPRYINSSICTLLRSFLLQINNISSQQTRFKPSHTLAKSSRVPTPAAIAAGIALVGYLSLHDATSPAIRRSNTTCWRCVQPIGLDLPSSYASYSFADFFVSTYTFFSSAKVVRDASWDGCARGSSHFKTRYFRRKQTHSGEFLEIARKIFGVALMRWGVRHNSRNLIRA